VARLNQGDVREILQALEDGINFMPKLGKREKMKMRIKIRKQFNWLSELSNPTAEMLFYRLEERLSDVFSSYPFGFGDRVKKLLQEKSARLRSS